MRQGSAEIAALFRCGRLALGLPAAIGHAYQRIEGLNAAFDRVVAPSLNRVISDTGERARIGVSLRTMSSKFGLAMLSYAYTARCEPSLEIVVLAGAATRLYDDLIDGDVDPRIGDRLGSLFGGRAETPELDGERLLVWIVQEIARRITASDDAAVFADLRSLHEFQRLSCRQREADISPAVLEQITQGKGAHANLVLCRLVNPRLGLVERELVMDLGVTFQMLDDYVDVDEDRRNGVTTLASLSLVTLADIGLRFRVLRRRMLAQYGRRGTRLYCGMLFFLLLQALAHRRLPSLGRQFGRAAGRSSTLAFLTRGDNSLPHADRDRITRPPERTATGQAEQTRQTEQTEQTDEETPCE
ncbi:hypothetical protein ACEZCY_16035 [Streptacidiphilus sp. N1-12]|uniref:Uncharacterized protein n=2 Tax=Streptacidiphilus alkalitolerans TaxID=3342712 RepID=A0ABV6VAT8_9ACTN